MTRLSFVLLFALTTGLPSEELRLEERGTFELDIAPPPAPFR
jgi:hypothetical protein